ncbi:MAG: nitroreductase family deazaflavin-dependent oxidoreductase [Chloroflexota bacterium]
MLGQAPPGGVLRGLFAMPRWLYRYNLDWILGHRFLLLTHRGRRSGRVYRTVVEVVRYDPGTRESVVVSAWGDRADWYRNLQAAPALSIQTGGQHYTPIQRFLTPEQVYQALRDYRRRNRWAAGIIQRLFGLPFDGTDTNQVRVQMLRGVAFRPARSPGA